MQSLERAWAEIDLDNLVYNFKQVQKQVGHRDIWAVIKADAYGHGAPQAARALATAGASRFAVATPQEAVQLRRHGITQPILLLGMADPAWAPVLAEKDIILTVSSLAAAKAYAKELEKAGQKAAVHFKTDTGMGRLGFDARDAGVAAGEIIEAANLPVFKPEGLFTHFAVADDANGNAYTNEQYALFDGLAKTLEGQGLRLPMTHCANSAAIIAHPGTWCSAVRPGIMLYGSNPSRHTPFDLRAPMSLRTRIAQIKAMRKGETTSYGRLWTAPKDSLVAVLSLGYADGLLRGLTGKLDMIVNGQKAPQVGRICMDMCMLDVTGIPGVQTGDAATVFGTDGDVTITADDVADAGGTISYEIFCAVGRRVPRFYKQNGQIQQEICYIDQL
ncbi:alanine racemase [Clostridia bacterium OttesenSCG-928-O13]|nr:alanine racemase [Clostridia bacterium OttesenSCG-928-O13]